jgi:hypothetical protein
VSREGLTGTERRAFETVARTLREEAGRARRAGDLALAADLRQDAARVALNQTLVSDRRGRAVERIKRARLGR